MAFVAALTAIADGVEAQFPRHSEFMAACLLDAEVGKILCLDAAGLLGGDWELPRLRDAWVAGDDDEEDELGGFVVVRCRMGGGNRECLCDGGPKCGACRAARLGDHARFVSDEDCRFDSTYNHVTFSARQGLTPVPSVKKFAVVVTDGAGAKTRAFACPGCGGRLAGAEDRVAIWRAPAAVAGWLRRHDRCARPPAATPAGSSG